MPKTTQAEIGIIGLATMGANLARNFVSKGVKTAVYNRTAEKTNAFLQEFGNDLFIGTKNLQEFVESLAKPRVIVLLIQAGDPVDEVLKDLTPLLEKGDIVMDFGNSEYHDTERRSELLAKKDINFWGCGISGGEEGALKGPSLMPGGNKETWKTVKPLLEKVAAEDFSKKPCVSYLGPSAAGHFVKTVHNGIEYGIMQLMAETYDLLRTMFKMPAPDISQIFTTYSRGKLGSFLFEIASAVLKKRDEMGDGYLIDKILDKAAQKGTGIWTSIEALKHGVAVPTIAEAVFARSISANPEQRAKLEKLYADKVKRENLDLDKFVDQLDDALFAASILVYAQGFNLLVGKSEEKKWDIDFAEVARIWQGGCIIRAKILKAVEDGYRTKGYEKVSFLELPEISRDLKGNMKNLAHIVGVAAENSVPAPAFASAHSYFLSATSSHGSANLIQALRDAFGTHTYERIDSKGSFHTDWDTNKK